MSSYLVLFREPDGRADEHGTVEQQNHQDAWMQWLDKFGAEGSIAGGGGLTLNGRLVKGIDAEIEETIHRVGSEIIGGFLLINAKDLNEATAIVKTCPVYEFGGYAEVREVK